MWMLSERSFRGRLLANHKEKKLDLVVSTHLTAVLLAPEMLKSHHPG